MRAERRQFDRIAAQDGDVKHSEFQCVDISEIGMRFNSRRAVEKGFVFTVEIVATEEPIDIHCRVLWCRENITGAAGEYQFGVTFDNYSMFKQARLREFISTRTPL